jgi:hypothetical protein
LHVVHARPGIMMKLAEITGTDGCHSQYGHGRPLISL